MKASGTVNWAWAPEWFVHSDGTRYLIVSTCVDNPVNLGNFFAWAAPVTSLSPVTLGTPVKLAGLPSSVDCYVIETGGYCYAFIKVRHDPDVQDPSASFPAGPWTSVLTGTSIVPDGNSEAPNVVNMGGGTWRCYYDRFNENGRIKYTDSTDNLASFGSPRTWLAGTECATPPSSTSRRAAFEGGGGWRPPVGGSGLELGQVVVGKRGFDELIGSVSGVPGGQVRQRQSRPLLAP